MFLFQGFVLSAFFFGYILTQVLGGVLADRHGGDRVLYLSACVWSASTFLLPFLDKFSFMPVTLGIIITQVVTGAAQGEQYYNLSRIVLPEIYNF